jgi:hypothetical protein
MARVKWLARSHRYRPGCGWEMKMDSGIPCVSEPATGFSRAKGALVVKITSGTRTTKRVDLLDPTSVKTSAKMATTGNLPLKALAMHQEASAPQFPPQMSSCFE